MAASPSEMPHFPLRSGCFDSLEQRTAPIPGAGSETGEEKERAHENGVIHLAVDRVAPAQVDRDFLLFDAQSLQPLLQPPGPRLGIEDFLADLLVGFLSIRVKFTVGTIETAVAPSGQGEL